MGAKSRAIMAAAAKSLAERKARDLGPTAPPCVACQKPSTGTIYVPGHNPRPVCDPLGCGITLAGDDYRRAYWTPHLPGKYREA